MAFFNLNEPRKFTHKPIFYDEDKEFHDALEKKARRELGLEDEGGKKDFSSLRGSFRGGSEAEKVTFNFRRTAERRSRTHLFVLVALLLGILFFLSKL